MYSKRQVIKTGLALATVTTAGCNNSADKYSNYTYQITVLNSTRQEQAVQLKITFRNGDEMSDEYKISERGAIATSEYSTPPSEIEITVKGQKPRKFKYASNQECPGENANITILVEKSDVLAAGTCGSISNLSTGHEESS